MDLGCLDKLVGKPYVKYGSDDRGYDCYGLAKRVSDIYGLGYPSIEYINSPISDAEHIESRRYLFQLVDIPRFGDLVAIRVGRYVAHVGVMLDNFRFIHSSKPFGVAITRIDSLKYSSRIEGFYRCKKN